MEGSGCERIYPLISDSQVDCFAFVGGYLERLLWRQTHPASPKPLVWESRTYDGPEKLLLAL